MSNHDNLIQTGTSLKTIGEQGALVVTGIDTPNVMTIGWAMASVMWFKNIFIAPIRLSRYSHELLEAHKEFTVFVPNEDMKKTIGICGSKSGRDTDKVALCGLKLAPSQKVAVPHIDAKGFVIECRVIYQDDLKEEALDAAVRERFYAGHDEGNIHTLYYGEILAQYELS